MCCCVRYQSVYSRVDGRLYTWGAGGLGQLGHGTREKRVGAPKVVGSLATERIVSVAAGPAHCVFLTESRRTFVSGDSRYHQLGLGGVDVQVSPTELTSIPPCATAACGACHTLFASHHGLFQRVVLGPQVALLFDVSCSHLLHLRTHWRHGPVGLRPLPFTRAPSSRARPPTPGELYACGQTPGQATAVNLFTTIPTVVPLPFRVASVAAGVVHSSGRTLLCCAEDGHALRQSLRKMPLSCLSERLPSPWIPSHFPLQSSQPAVARCFPAEWGRTASLVSVELLVSALFPLLCLFAVVHVA